MPSRLDGGRPPAPGARTGAGATAGAADSRAEGADPLAEVPDAPPIAARASEAIAALAARPGDGTEAAGAAGRALEMALAGTAEVGVDGLTVAPSGRPASPGCAPGLGVAGGGGGTGARGIAAAAPATVAGAGEPGAGTPMDVDCAAGVTGRASAEEAGAEAGVGPEGTAGAAVAPAPVGEGGGMLPGACAGVGVSRGCSPPGAGSPSGV